MSGDGPTSAALLTVSEAASLLRVSPSAIRRRARAGLLRPHQSLGRPARFALAQVLALASQERAAPLEAKRHSCLFVRGRAQFRSALLAQVAEPLAAGASVLLALDQAAARLGELLDEPAVRRAHAEGRLEIHEAEQIYLTAGRFDVASLLDRLTHLRGDPGSAKRPFILVGEMSWAARMRLGDELIAYESGLNSWLARQLGLSLICVYDSSLFNGETALAMLQAHPTTCLDGVCRTGLGI